MMCGVSESTTSVPRVVRVSTLHNVGQAKWLALLFAPVMPVSGYYLLAHVRDPLRDRLWWGVSVIALLYTLVFGVMIPGLVALVSGTFTADDRGIEFMPYTPRLRLWQFIAWAEMKRVQWVGMIATLVSDDASLRINWRDLHPGDRKALKAHVEAALAKDFDLTIATSPPISWRRLAVAAVVPVTSSVLCFAFAMRHPRYVSAPLILMGAWIVVAYAVAIKEIFKQKRNPQSPHSWRVRRAAT